MLHERKFRRSGPGVNGIRKRRSRSGHPLRLVNIPWRARTPANGNREGREGQMDRSPPDVHERALCNSERCRTCHDIVMAARDHKARQLWLRGCQLCVAAALCRAAGRLVMAANAIDHTCAILRRRGDICEVEFGNN
jgi:hypothetical protein